MLKTNFLKTIKEMTIFHDHVQKHDMRRKKETWNLNMPHVLTKNIHKILEEKNFLKLFSQQVQKIQEL